MILLPPVFFIIYNSIPLIQPGQFQSLSREASYLNAARKCYTGDRCKVSIAQSRGASNSFVESD
jgi:hypothetical protein